MPFRQAMAVACLAAHRRISAGLAGAIGELLPTDKMARVLPSLVSSKARRAIGFAAADATTTTDTYPKAATATAMIDGAKVTINGGQRLGLPA